MIRHLSWAAPLALGLVCAQALAAGKVPPPEYAAFFEAVRKADTIADPLQRCLAYPDLPGNTWAPGLAQARCRMFLTPAPYTLDDIDKLLARPDGATTLDATFRAALDAHFNVPAQREYIFIALSVFRDEDLDHAERTARAWLKASPDGAFAHAALGHALAGRGYDARGTKFMRDTPEDNVRRMEAFFVEATKAYVAALEAEKKLLPACTGLIYIGRQSSDILQEFATRTCLAIDPASFFVVDAWMDASEPRWGGSLEQMRAVSAYAQARVDKNPAMALFAHAHAAYEIERLDDSDAQALAVLEPAAKQVPHAGYMRSVGGAWLRKQDDWKAFVYLSEALRFSPPYETESRWRALVLKRLGEPAWARADAERAVALDPDNGHAHRILGDIVRETDGPAAAVPHFRRAMEDSKAREGAFNSLCGSLIDADQRAAASQCVDELLAAYPENPEGWRQRLILIGYDAPGSVEAMERFLALHDPKRWSYHAAAADTVGKVLAMKQGTASPSDRFDARVTRARSMERTPEGRAYVERTWPLVTRSLEQSLRGCPEGGPGDLTLVMDVEASGKLVDVAARPVNDWTSCVAKGLQAAFDGPPPPDSQASTGFPITLDLKRK